MSVRRRQESVYSLRLGYQTTICLQSSTLLESRRACPEIHWISTRGVLRAGPLFRVGFLRENCSLRAELMLKIGNDELGVRTDNDTWSTMLIHEEISRRTRLTDSGMQI